MNFVHAKLKRGMSMIEIVVYVTLLALMLVVVVNTLTTMSRVYRPLKAEKAINSHAAALMERLTREIKQSLSIDTALSIFNVHPGRLVLNTNDGGSTVTLDFYYDNGKIGVKKNSVFEGYLLSAQATSTNLIFRLATTTRSAAVKIEMTLQSGEHDYLTTQTFYSTAVSRGSYLNN